MQSWMTLTNIYFDFHVNLNAVLIRPCLGSTEIVLPHIKKIGRSIFSAFLIFFCFFPLFCNMLRPNGCEYMWVQMMDPWRQQAHTLIGYMQKHKGSSSQFMMYKCLICGQTAHIYFNKSLCTELMNYYLINSIIHNLPHIRKYSWMLSLFIPKVFGIFFFKIFFIISFLYCCSCFDSFVKCFQLFCLFLF